MSEKPFVKTCVAGETIVRENDKVTHILVVRSGSVGRRSRTLPESDIVYQAGAIIGDSQLILGKLSIFKMSVTALEDTEILFVPIQRFRDELASMDSILRTWLKCIVVRDRGLFENMTRQRDEIYQQLFGSGGR